MMIEDDPTSIGICGATASTVAARNFARMVASGASAHMDHGRETALTFLAAAKGECPFEIKDEKKLHFMESATKYIFEVQQEVARMIADELFANISNEAREGIDVIPTDNMKAYELYLKGNEIYFQGRGSRDINKIHESHEYFNHPRLCNRRRYTHASCIILS